MGGGAWDANNYKARTAGEGVFAVNYTNGAYGSSGLTKAFVEAEGKVTGTASVTIPMTIMVLFGQGSKTITVVCDEPPRDCWRP
jgi:hypothetical protein